MTKAQVSVKVYGTAGGKANVPIDEYIGRQHAQSGAPVAITITRGNYSETKHLSWSEATALYDALHAARKGRS